MRTPSALMYTFCHKRKRMVWHAVFTAHDSVGRTAEYIIWLVEPDFAIRRMLRPCLQGKEGREFELNTYSAVIDGLELSPFVPES